MLAPSRALNCGMVLCSHLLFPGSHQFISILKSEESCFQKMLICCAAQVSLGRGHSPPSSCGQAEQHIRGVLGGTAPEE